MRENLKQILDKMFEELEGKSIAISLIGNDEYESPPIEKLHIYNTTYNNGRDYIVLSDELDINEYNHRIAVDSIISVSKDNEEWLIIKSGGTDNLISIN